MNTIFVFLILFAVIKCAPAEDHSGGNDYIALTSLYEATNGASWRNNSNWLVLDDLCTWYGVMCIHGEANTTQPQRSYNVTLLDNDLSGTIPSQLAMMDRLISLDLRHNHLLTGMIPSEIWLLSNIINLRLGDNGLTGSLSSEIGLLTSLQYFELGQSSITGSIPTEIGLLTNLEALELNDNLISGPLPSEIGLIVSLLTFSIQENFIVGAMPSEIGNLKNLLHLNALSNKFISEIPSEFQNLKAVAFVDLGVNHFSGILPSEIGLMASLKSFYIDSNSFSSTLPSELSFASNLTYLNIANAGFFGTVPTELALLSSLNSLILSYNSLTGTLPAEFGYLSYLEFIEIRNNDMTGTIPTGGPICDRIDSVLLYLYFDCSEIFCECCSTCNVDTASPQESPITPFIRPTVRPTVASTKPSSQQPSPSTSKSPISSPSLKPTKLSALIPSTAPATSDPTKTPTGSPLFSKSLSPTKRSSQTPSAVPTTATSNPTKTPTGSPLIPLSTVPTVIDSIEPSDVLYTDIPSNVPSKYTYTPSSTPIVPSKHTYTPSSTPSDSLTSIAVTGLPSINPSLNMKSNSPSAISTKQSSNPSEVSPTLPQPSLLPSVLGGNNPASAVPVNNSFKPTQLSSPLVSASPSHEIPTPITEVPVTSLKPSMRPSLQPTRLPTITPPISTDVLLLSTLETDYNNITRFIEYLQTYDEDFERYLRDSTKEEVESIANLSSRRLGYFAFEVTNLTSFISDSSGWLCSVSEPNNQCYLVDTTVNILHHPRLFSPGLVNTIVTDTAVGFIAARGIFDGYVPTDVEAAIEILLTGVQNELMGHNIIPIFEQSVVNFLNQGIISDIVVESAQLLYQSLTEFEQDEDRRATMEGNAILMTKVNITGVYIPPPEIEFDKVIVDTFDEDDNEFVDILLNTEEPYFKEVSAVSAVSMTNNDKSDSSLDEPFGKLGLVGGSIIIGLGVFICVGLTLVVLYNKKKRLDFIKTIGERSF